MRRLRILAGLIGVAGLVLYLSAYSGLLRLAYPEAWLMITIATLASVYGYWAGIGAALVALALDAHFEVDHNLLEPLVIYVISAFLAAWLGHQLRQTYRQKRQALRQLTLLVQAQNTLSDLSSREAVFSALPNLLGQYGEGHVSLWQPQAHGFRLVSAFAFEGWPDQLLPENGVVGRAFHQARTLYVPDVRLEPDYVQAPPGQTLAELALPLWEGEEVVAVLNLERPGPFMDEELDALKLFAATASRRLTRLSEQARLSLLDELSQTLNSTPSLKSMAQRALPLLASGLEVEAGALMQQQGSRLVILAQWGPLPPSQQHLVEEGIPFGQGLSWVVQQENHPIFSDNYSQDERALPELRAQEIAAMILHPIPLPDTSQARFVLGLQTQRPRQWKQHEKNLLAQAARAIGLAFESALERERMEVLLSLHRQIAQAAPETAYQAILEAAVHTVPGVEAGSLMLRQGETFAFKATVGFDLAAVQELRFGEAQQEQWYGLSSQEWKQGLPRILSPQIDRVTERSRQNSDSEKMDLGGLVADIQANLCLPIPYRGEVLALLNLDNLHDPAAFGQDSLQAAQIFSSVVGSLMHELRYRALLEESALSDSLTGLGNRRAFDHKLQEELARASRYGYPLSLLMMDLQGFKRINDYLGHAKGDEALIQVALALKSQRRNGDSLYRWGGDEFAAILPHADRSGAIATANRYAKAIKEIDIEGLGLGINVGASSFPEEAKGYDQLLGVADDRMYQAKAQGVPLLED